MAEQSPQGSYSEGFFPEGFKEPTEASGKEVQDLMDSGAKDSDCYTGIDGVVCNI